MKRSLSIQYHNHRPRLRGSQRGHGPT